MCFFSTQPYSPRQMRLQLPTFESNYLIYDLENQILRLQKYRYIAYIKSNIIIIE